MAECRTSIDINAAPEIVFEYLVTDAGLTSRMGQWASLNPVPGGHFAVDVAGYPARGSFLEVDPPRRVKVSWGFAGNDTLPPGSSTGSLTPISAGTRVEVVHSDLPADEVSGHREGWNHFLPRLAGTAVGQQPQPESCQPRIFSTTYLKEFQW